ncbi:stability/partitioning determinant (plasmid) [Pseudomonas yamanorum]|nr:stability/partitioning determinant [Pseudomonas yamanorum]
MSEESKAPNPTPAAFANLGSFKVKPASPEPIEGKQLARDIDRVAESNGFHSRQAAPPKKERFNSTEPKKQLNIRIPIPTHDRFYRMAEERGIRLLGDLMELALDALEASEKTKKQD